MQSELGLYFNEQLFFLLRMVVAGICGGIIGFEREKKIKFAGVRTHIIIALAACIMMIISKYGFADVIREGYNYDVSRVAAGIVAGMGIIGGGVVISNKQGTVSGITTAAGIWLTIAISMAIGAGMWALGIMGTILVEVIQRHIHVKNRFINQVTHESISIRLGQNKDRFYEIADVLGKEGIQLSDVKFIRKDEQTWDVKCQAVFTQPKERNEIVKIFYDLPEIESFEIKV